MRSRHILTFGLAAAVVATASISPATAPQFVLYHVDLGGAPRRVEIGDVDNDLDADLVVLAASPTASALSIVRNDGPGSFAIGWTKALAPVPIPFQPDLDLGDVDADGDPDLTIVLANADKSTRINAGDGTFEVSKPMVVAGLRIDNELGHLDGDGLLDLAYHELDLTGYVGSRKGLGDGTFGGFGPEIPGGSTDVAARSALGDVTNDGLLDLVQASSSGLLLVRGASSPGVQGWQFPTLLLAAGNFGDVALADLDGDGLLDAVASKPKDKAVAVLLGSPSGAPGPAAVYAAGPQPLAVAVADLGNDGVLDVATTSLRSGTVEVLEGRGDGSFHPPVPILAARRPEDVAAGDLDSDGDADLAVTDASSGRLVLLFNQAIP